jgi:hypothetical protein
MKIAATVTESIQVGMDQYLWHDINKTKIFDSSESIDSIIAWAQTINKGHDFHSIRFSEVKE